MKEIHTVGVIVECQNQILILLRNPDISHGNTWALPAGRLNPNEKHINAAIRELFEETGLKTDPDKLKITGNFDWLTPKIRVYFTTYLLKLESKFKVKIDPNEHQKYQWITPKECHKKTNLIHGFHELLEKFYEIKK